MKRSSELDVEGSSDHELVAAFRKTGDTDAFKAIVLRHANSIRRFLALGLKPSDDLDEAEQEALIRLCNALRSFDSRSSLLTFVYSICRKTTADQVRRSVRERKKLRRFAVFHGTDESDDRDEPHRQYTQEETKGEILAALDLLGEPDRSILYLRDAEGISVSELSQTFGLPEGTVKSRLSRSREKLRPILESIMQGRSV